MKIQTRSESGFTLIELMVVIVIIGILVAIALPNFAASISRSKIANVKANAKVLQNSVEAFNIDNSSYPDSIAEITGHSSYKVFRNPFTGEAGLATASGKGAWRTNDNGAVGAQEVSPSYNDSALSQGLVIYVGLNADGEASTRFLGTGQQAATPPTTQNYMIYACDDHGMPVRGFLLTAGRPPTLNAEALQTGAY